MAEAGIRSGVQRQLGGAGRWWLWANSRWTTRHAGRLGGERVYRERSGMTTNATDGGGKQYEGGGKYYDPEKRLRQVG